MTLNINSKEGIAVIVHVTLPCIVPLPLLSVYLSFLPNPLAIHQVILQRNSPIYTNSSKGGAIEKPVPVLDYQSK